MDIETLASLTKTSRRTIRFYVQEGLLPAPEGETRAADYGDAHLERLLAIRRLQLEGLTLAGIRRRLDAPQAVASTDTPPGTVEVWSHIHLQAGVLLQIEPSQARLSSDQISRLATVITQWLAHEKSAH